MSTPAATGAMRTLTQFLKIGTAVAAPTIAFKLARDSYDGAKPVWTQKEMEHHMDQEKADMEYGWGHYSGQPGFDHWAHKLFRGSLFGPGGLFTMYHRAKIYGEGLLTDVIWKNIVPIGLAVAGIYAGLGKDMVHKPFKELYKMIGPAFTHVHFPKAAFGTAVKKGTQGVIKGIGFTANNARYTLPVLGLAAFVLYRLGRVMNHDEQHDFFREENNIQGDH